MALRAAAAVLALVSMALQVASSSSSIPLARTRAIERRSNLLFDILDGHIASRMRVADQLQAERQEMMDRAAAAATRLAAERPWAWKLQKILPPAVINYVDVSEVPLAASKDLLDVTTADPQGANYPRMPTVVVPKPIWLTSCPEANSVTSFGGNGDGYTDNVAPVQSAQGAPTAYIYFPPGAYVFLSSVTINKPIYLGRGATLIAARGVTVTLTQRLHHWDNRAAFGGQGKIELSGAADLIRPDWFKQQMYSDSDTLQVASDSCRGSCDLVLTRMYIIDKIVYLRQQVGVFSTGAAELNGRYGPGRGIVLRPGRYTRPIAFGAIVGFRVYAIKIKGGVSNAEIQTGTIYDGGSGIVFAPAEGKVATIDSVHVTHFTATTKLQNTVLFRAKNPSHTLVNCLVRGNFVLEAGHLDTNQPSAATVFRGQVPPTLVATSVVFQAIDADQSRASTQFAVLRNTLPIPADNLAFRGEAWVGGLSAGGKLVAGRFSNLNLLARMPAGIQSIDQLALGADGGAGNNRVSLSAVSSAGIERLMASSPSLGQFNNGQITTDQVLYLNVPASDWRPGASQAFYFYNVFARTADKRITCLPFRAANTGIVCDSAEVVDPAAGLIKLVLKNTSSVRTPSWMTLFRFGVQVGP